MKIPFLALIFQGIPEMIAIVTLAFTIAKAPMEWKKICIIGVISGVTSYFLRLLPLTFGIHTVLLIGVLFFFLTKYAKINFNSALIGSLISFLTIVVAETLCLSLLMPLVKVTPEVFFENILIRILLTWPQVIMLFILSYIIYTIRNIKR